MNRLVLVLLFVLVTYSYHALAPDWDWVDFSSGTGNENVTDAACNSQGDIFVVGTFTSTITLGSFALNCIGSSNTFVGKLDHQGVWLWAISYIGGTSDAPQIAISVDGNIYITGYYTGTFTIMGSNYICNGGTDLYLLSLNGDGSFRWFLSKGGSGNEYSTCLDTDNDGNVYISGYFASSALIWDTYNFPNHGSYDIFVAKVSATGNLIWLNNAYSGYSDYSSSISVRNNIFCIGGATTSIATTYFGTIPVVSDNSGVSPVDGIIGVGNMATGEWTFATNLWAWGVGYYRQVAVGSVDIDSQNRIDIGGGFCQQVHLGSTILYAADIEMDGFCGQMRLDGTWNWAFSFNDPGQNNGYCDIETDPQDNLLVTSYFRNSLSFSSGFTPVSSLGGYDFLAVKISSAGSFLWTKTIQGNGEEIGRITYNPWGYPIAFGHVSSSPTYFDSLQHTSQGNDLFIAKIDNVKASFTVDLTTVHTNMPVHFTNTSTCFPLSCQWDFNGDGITDSSESNPTYSYNIPGFFTVSLIVSDGTHSSTMTKTNYINAIQKPETDWMWALSLGGSGSDEIKDIVCDSEGNTYIAGHMSESIIINGTTYYSTGQSDVFVAKYNYAGQCLWFRQVTGNAADYINDLAIGNDGSLYITGGYGSSNFTFPGLPSLPAPGGTDLYLAEIDTNGNWLWARYSTGSSSNIQGSCITTDATNNVYVGGYFYSGNINLGSLSFSSSGSWDGFVAKLNASGTWLWGTSVAGSSDEIVSGLTATNDGCVAVSGYMTGSSVSFGGNFTLTSYGGKDVFVGKINPSAGIWVWVRKGGGTGNDYPPDGGGGIFCSSDGSIYLPITTASSTSTWGNLPAMTLAPTTQAAYIAKISGSGEWQWLSGNYSSTATAKNLIITNEGYSYLTGSFQGRTFFGEYQLDSSGSDDVFVSKYDPQGNILWAMHAGGTGSDCGSGLGLDNSGSLSVGGVFNGTASFQGSSVVSAGGMDGFLARISVVTSNFRADVTLGQVPLTVHFTDQSAGTIDSWAWDFDGDNITDSTEQNPTWTYNTSGYFNVTLTVTEDAITETTTKFSYIHSYYFDTDFTANTNNGFLPLTVSFSDITDGDIISRLWDFNNDGVNDSETENPVWTYLFPGQYTVSLIDFDPSGSNTEIKTNYITTSLNPSITHYVPTDYPTIQAAINASNNGDYIIVEDGTYYENLVIEGKNITLGSYFFVDGDSTHIANTIIDGGNAINPDQASTITILPGSGRPDTTPFIIGFTIRNGSGRRIVQNEGGTTIEKRVGGGIYIRQSNPVFIYNKIEDNDADDEGGGSYAFQSIPNHGGMINAAIGLHNPGGNYFANNTADIGADIYIYGVTNRDPLKVENCSFEVMSVADTTVSNYWVNSSAALSYSGSSGREAAITTDVFVATNGSDTLNSGTSAASPFKTIDHALSRIYATPDNPLTIHIASGTFSPSLTGEKYPLQMVKHVSLQGAGKEETFLDAEASADFPRRVLNLDKVEGVSISDLTLMGGFVTLAKNYNGGGIGIISSTANLNNILLAGSSSAGNGAGLYAFQSSITADSISLEYNAALGSGGGVYAMETDLELSNSTVLNNSANKNGAGIAADNGNIQILNSEIANNQATGYQSKGGGISLSNTTAALIRQNQIKANNADLGAGIYLQNNAELALYRNTITNNLADFNGGGLFVNTTTGLFTNNLIANNTASQRGGAIYCYSAPEISNCPIANNKANMQGGGLYQNTGSPLHTDTIYWGNVMGAGNTPNQVYLYSEDADPAFSYCNIQGSSADFALANGISYTGTYTNNQNIDPLFAEPSEAAGHFYLVGEASFTLQDGSPCIDSGNPTTDPSDFPFDLAGNPRIDNSTIDIGAYEAIHYNGAIISANPTAIDFGRVNIHATPPTAQLTISNTGNQDMLITDIGLEFSTAVFSFETGQRTQTINPGASITLNLTFSPSTIGTQANNLIIHSNALNTPVFSIPLSGTGIDASTSYPSNVQLQVIGDDVHLSWNPVLSDPLGNPYTPDCYIVLYSENADTILDNYFFLAFQEEPNYVHNRVARYRNKMFYKIIAIDELTRSAIINLNRSVNAPENITWGVIKQGLNKRN